MLGAVLVYPDSRCVLPFAPEEILKQDGVKKNDCERNAARRLLHDLPREHPHMKLTIIENGLASNAPHIQTLRELNMNFILGAKKSDHAYLFDQVSLNASNLDCKVNFLECWETSPKGKIQHFSWVTDFSLNCITFSFFD